MVLATLNIDGKPTKVVMDANRNGFFYVLDRTDGRLITANQYAKETWAKAINLETGKPVPAESRTRCAPAKRWMYGLARWAQRTGARYRSIRRPASCTRIPYFGMHYKPIDVQYRPGLPFWGADIKLDIPRRSTRLSQGNRSAYRQGEVGSSRATFRASPACCPRPAAWCSVVS